jgi:endonuclease/exonuclease/phosphatase family metal-dependent hydrolase
MKLLHLRYSTILVCSVLFLFFFQLIADFIGSIYAIGLLSTSLTPEVASALLLLSPIILVFFRKVPSGKLLALLGALVLLSRVVEVMLDTRGRMIVSGLGVASFMIFLPSLLWNHQKESDSQTHSQNLGVSLALSVLLSILLRTLGSGVDLSIAGGFQAIGWALALLTGVFLLRAIPTSTGTSQPASSFDQPEIDRAQPWIIIGLSLGMAAVFVLLYFAFTSPTVIARWTGASYPLILTVLLLALGAFVVGLAWKPLLLARLNSNLLLAWNALFVLCLTLTILAHQVHYPPTPAGYPFSPDSMPFHEIPLFLMLLLAPVILLDFTLFSRAIISEKPSHRLLGGSFALASFLILLMSFAQVFTTVYDYIPVVGPFFRDKFWLVFLVDGVVLGLSVLLVRKNKFGIAEERGLGSFPLLPVVFMAFIFVATLSGPLLTAPMLSAPSESRVATLRVITYNIQQGYSQDGQINFDSQLSLLRETNPDVIGLQECDTARIAGGNIDIVRYFANQLDMYSYYGPSTVAGTFGIALLSRYPIHNPRTFYLYSVGEQTAIISAQLVINGETYNVYVTHLGNDGPIIQQEQVLQLVQGQENVLLMGDFNFRSETDQYRLTTAALSDAWLLRWPQGIQSQEFDSSDRIDYLYVSPGMKIVESQYLAGPQSDHPALVTDIGR